jgi:hypothetical protein
MTKVVGQSTFLSLGGLGTDITVVAVAVQGDMDTDTDIGMGLGLGTGTGTGIHGTQEREVRDGAVSADGKAHPLPSTPLPSSTLKEELRGVAHVAFSKREKRSSPKEAGSSGEKRNVEYHRALHITVPLSLSREKKTKSSFHRQWFSFFIYSCRNFLEIFFSLSK